MDTYLTWHRPCPCFPVWFLYPFWHGDSFHPQGAIIMRFDHSFTYACTKSGSFPRVQGWIIRRLNNERSLNFSFIIFLIRSLEIQSFSSLWLSMLKLAKIPFDFVFEICIWYLIDLLYYSLTTTSPYYFGLPITYVRIITYCIIRSKKI